VLGKLRTGELERVTRKLMMGSNITCEIVYLLILMICLVGD